ncbi:Delta(24)-sterol reductase [Acorus calamus]|uniref:Delta(24)-sterol reductase n=1 Tax=Acorus calamus TaxID=4465 RepID=A0AAV9F7M4_ACOCL|nr:Delta(24)-sterol reductase [Acorus calamus]
MEEWMIQNHGFQPQYSVFELTEKNFWRMFDADLYEYCRKKYGEVAVGTFMGIYYKFKKGKKTEEEVREAEQAHLQTETAIAEVD